MTFRDAELRSEYVQDQEESVRASLEQDLESAPFRSATEHAPATTVNPIMSNPLLTTELKTHSKDGRPGRKRIFIEQTGTSMPKTAEDALSDTFYGGLGHAHNGVNVA